MSKPEKLTNGTGITLEGLTPTVSLTKGSAPKFEDVLAEIGEFGPFQIRLFSILTLMDLGTGQCMMFFVFANRNPGWKCQRYHGDVNASLLHSNESSPMFSSNENLTRQGCYQAGAECEEITFSGAFSSIVSEWGLVCDLSYVPKLAVSIQMVGVLLGALVTGQLADLFGRKKTLMTVASGMMFIQAVVAISSSWQLYIFLRFLTCICLGGTMCLITTIPMEFIGQKWRTFCGSLSLFVLGLILQCLWAYLLGNWRLQALVSGLSTTPLLICILFWVPESVRWLVQKGLFHQAEDIVRGIAKTNGREMPDLSVLKAIALRDNQERQNRQRYSYLDLFRGKKLASRTAVLLFTWFTCSTIFYGISTQYGSLSGNFYINTLISPLIALPFAWTVILTGLRFGRRWSFVGYMVIPSCCMAIVLIFICTGLDTTYPTLVRAFTLLGKGAVNACWMLAAIYSSELYPTLMRNIGMAACSMFARLAGAVTPQITYLGMLYHRSIPYAVYTLFAITCALLVFTVLPDTKDRPLPETLVSRDPDVEQDHESAEESSEVGTCET